MTSWVRTQIRQKHVHTHYYVGLESICGDGAISSGAEGQVHIKKTEKDNTFCTTCKDMLKTNRIHRDLEKREKKIINAQKKAATFKRTLEYMLLNAVTAPDTRTVKIAEIKELFFKEFEIDAEDIILSLILAKKITILGDDSITVCTMEAQHVR